MKLKNRTVLNLHQAIIGISSGFAFPTQTKVNIIRNAQILENAFAAQETWRKSAIAAISPDGSGKTIDETPELLARFNKERDEMLEATVGVSGLLFINWTDLDVAGVKPDQIVRLAKLVRGLPEAPASDVIPDTDGDS